MGEIGRSKSRLASEWPQIPLRFETAIRNARLAIRSSTGRYVKIAKSLRSNNCYRLAIGDLAHLRSRVMPRVVSFGETVCARRFRTKCPDSRPAKLGAPKRALGDWLRVLRRVLFVTALLVEFLCSHTMKQPRSSFPCLCVAEKDNPQNNL